MNDAPSGPDPDAPLELDDIQSGVFSPRPSPYAATYILLRIDDPAQGREAIRRLSGVVASCANIESPARDAWVSVCLTWRGLQALGVPQASLDSFPWELRQGMAARAGALGDAGENAPEHWERPLGTDEVHVVIVAQAPDPDRLEAAVARGRAAFEDLPGVMPIWRQDCRAPPDHKEPFGFRDGMGQPVIEGRCVGGVTPDGPPLKAGEFVLGYRDEMGGLPPAPVPDELGRNGTYVAFRKLHQRVAAFRKYVKDNATSPEDEELVAAKMMGRWRSGAPLALCPLHDDPALGDDDGRNNLFLYKEDDAVGYRTPLGSHIRRCNPRDADVAGVTRLHRMLRRGTAYGPPLPEGVTEDDGQDRGLMFAFIGTHLDRQFEFVQSEWINHGAFLGLGDAKDPVAGAPDGDASFSIPRKPVPRRLRGLSRFVVTRGGEYAFMPGLRALRWLAEPH